MMTIRLNLNNTGMGIIIKNILPKKNSFSCIKINKFDYLQVVFLLVNFFRNDSYLSNNSQAFLNNV